MAPGDHAALHIALSRLLGDPPARGLAAAARGAAADGPYSWDAGRRRTLEVYRAVLGRGIHDRRVIAAQRPP